MASVPPVSVGISHIAFRASPRGKRAGFAVLPDGAGGALTVTVLPKPWGQVNRRHMLLPDHVPGTTSHLTLFEMDSADVSSLPAAVGELTQGILEISGQEGRQDLLQLIRRPGGGIPAPSGDGRAFESVVSLMLLAKRGKASIDDGYRGAVAESILRLVEQQLFIDEVRRVIDRARPGYIERSDQLSSPRGALSGTSLALALLTGRPEIECRFDEQSTDTVVLQIVLAGLRAVATDRFPRFLAHIAAPIRSQAVALARRLDSVTVLDSERALLAARRLVLNPLERSWAGAVNGAVQVLSRKSVVPVDGGHEAERAIAIHLHMEKWWEQCLRHALSNVADPGTVCEQVPVRAPWAYPDAVETPDTDRRADFIFGLGGRPMLADAKYKLNKLDVTTLEASDGDQLFAYSHTAVVPDSDQLTEIGIIIYPQRHQAMSQGRARTRDLMVRVTDPRYELRLLDVPFPTPTDVASDGAWRDYVIGLADVVRNELTIMGELNQPRATTEGS